MSQVTVKNDWLQDTPVDLSKKATEVAQKKEQ